jgi:hypothetical protein
VEVRTPTADAVPSEAVAGVDAVVVALAEPAASGAATPWERILADHAGLPARIHTDARWARAASDAERPLRLVTIADSATSAGRSRGQSAAHHARTSRAATEDRVSAYAISDEGGDPAATAALAAHLVGHPESPTLSGAELVVGPGWLGLRSHPRPIGSTVLGAPTVPGWLDGVLRAVVGTEEER